jgi:HemK-related putative methylase
MQLTDKATNEGWLQVLLQTAARFWLTLRYQVLDRRYGRLVIETINDVPLIVLPEVFNPVLFRSGAFMAQALADAPFSAEARVLDMGTGSGVGAIFAARRGAQVTAVDINPDAVRCARINALLNDLSDKIVVLEGDLFAPVTGQRFDMILFNPPFYRGLPANKLDFAWRSQDIFERFTADLVSFLRPNGRAWIILSSDGDGHQLLGLLEKAGFTVRPVARKNLINEILTIHEVKQHV